METPEPAPLTDAERVELREFLSMCVAKGYLEEEQRQKAEHHLAQSLTEDEFSQRMDSDPDFDVVEILSVPTNEAYGLPSEKWRGILWEPWNLPTWTSGIALAVALLALAVSLVVMNTGDDNPQGKAIGLVSFGIFMTAVLAMVVFDYGRPILPDRLPAPSRWTVASLLAVRGGFRLGVSAGFVTVAMIVSPLLATSQLLGGPDRFPWLGPVWGVLTLLAVPGVIVTRIAMSLRFRKVRRALDDGAETSLITRT